MNDDGICPGQCNSRWRKAQAAYKAELAAYRPLDADQSRPEPPSIRPAEGNPWCPECRSLIREQLAQLDLLAALRHATADGYPADAGAQKVSGSREQASPSPHADDVDDVARMLAGWEQAYRDLKGWPSGPRYGDLASQRTECIAWLAERLDGILVSPMAADFGAEVQQWHADLKAKAKAGVRVLRKPLRCPACRLLMLKWTEGEKYVRCYNPDCNLLLPLDDYEAMTARVASGITESGAELESLDCAHGGMHLRTRSPAA